MSGRPVNRPDMTIDAYRGRKTTTQHSSAWAEDEEIQATDIQFNVKGIRFSMIRK